MEVVRLTCQMAALAALSMQRWRSCNMARRLQIVAPCRSKQRNNFADVCVLHDFRRHQRKQTAYGRINTDKVDGCLKRLTRVMLKLERRILLFFLS